LNKCNKPAPSVTYLKLVTRELWSSLEMRYVWLYSFNSALILSNLKKLFFFQCTRKSPRFLFAESQAESHIMQNCIPLPHPTSLLLVSKLGHVFLSHVRRKILCDHKRNMAECSLAFAEVIWLWKMFLFGKLFEWSLCWRRLGYERQGYLFVAGFWTLYRRTILLKSCKEPSWPAMNAGHEFWGKLRKSESNEYSSHFRGKHPTL